VQLGVSADVEDIELKKAYRKQAIKVSKPIYIFVTLADL